MISEDILNLREQELLDIARPEDMTDEKKFCRNQTSGYGERGREEAGASA